MPSARPQVRLRPPLIALLVAIALAGSAREVRASGCHAVDRPVLGLTFSWDEPEAALDQFDARRPSLTPLPCRDEVPGAVSMFSAVPISAIVAAADLPQRPRATGRWRPIPPVPLSRRPRATSIERPPRPVPPLA